MVNWLMVTLVIKKDTWNLEGYAGIGFVKTMSH
jgi:hypothetical protein